MTVTLDTEDGWPLSCTTHLIAALTGTYGTEYTAVLVEAVEHANRNDQARYREMLDTAITILAAATGDRSAAKALAVVHVGFFYAAISADIDHHR